MRIQDLIEEARQKALLPRGPTQCRVCQCEIPPEKRRGPPRLTCETCDLFQRAALHPLPRHCEQCGKEFWPDRDAARFCSDRCRCQSGNERRRLAYRDPKCIGCGMPMAGRARRFCAPECRQQYRNALKRKSEAPAVRTCPQCDKVFAPWRAGVIFCSRPCAKRRADRNYSARRRKARAIRKA
jgi:predicted nucleic acid-binding Zn ribbon protein